MHWDVRRSFVGTDVAAWGKDWQAGSSPVSLFQVALAGIPVRETDTLFAADRKRYASCMVGSYLL